MKKLDNAFALLIGVGADLPVTVRDATAVYNILADEHTAGYDKENIILLTDEKANREGILQGFDTLLQKTDDDSSVLLFYSGHGGYSEELNQYYLVPNGMDPVEYESTWVTAQELQDKIKKLNSRRLIFFLDCCHAAGMIKTVDAPVTNLIDKPAEADGLAQKIDDGRGMSIISSCREDQQSFIMDGDFNSLFTKCLLEVLKGKHKTYFEEEYIRISEVFQYIFKRVPECQPLQHPYANLQIYDDFAVSYIPESLRQHVHLQQEEPLAVPDDKDAAVRTVYREKDDATRVILFVHGFSGEGAETFGKLPDFLITDERFTNYNMYPIGYTKYGKPELGKGIWASPLDIMRIADYLKTSIKYRFAKYEKIILIGHGLGGLVVQEALLELSNTTLDRISHVFLIATPSNGLKSTMLEKFWNKRYRELSTSGEFISGLRNKWKKKFSKKYPFILKAIAATDDEYVPIESSLAPFKSENQLVLMGRHFSIINPKSPQDENFKALTNLIVMHPATSSKNIKQETEVKIAKEEYGSIIDELLPRVNELDKRGVEQLIYALEGAGRQDEALGILQQYVVHKKDSDMLGILGGRHKRKYLKTYHEQDAKDAYTYYTEALKLAQENSDCKQQYYHAINLAFISLIAFENERAMQDYAKLALENCDQDPFDSLWRLATIAEANLYLGNLEQAKTFYSKAAALAGNRERISIHTNAYTAYTCLMQTDNLENDFIKFLKIKFLL